MPKVGIRTRFTLILSIIFIVAIVAAWAVFSQVLQQRAEAQITEQAIVLMSMLNSVRSYTNEEVNPLLQDDLKTQHDFIPASVPAFSARNVFERFRSNSDYQHFMYKEAAPNPTNMENLADPMEMQMVDTFRSNPSLTELTGFTTLDGQEVFYNSRPMRIASENCLTCHGDPKDAPASLINTYGSEHGFGWKLGDVIAAQTLYLPASDVFAEAQNAMRVVMGIIVVLFALVVLVTNLLLRRVVVRPVVQIAHLAELIQADTLTPESPQLATVSGLAKRSDELGSTAQVLKRMAEEIYAREQKLKAQIQSLKIQIDTEKQYEQVGEITETEYFRNLQARVKQMRQTGTVPSVGKQNAKPDSPSDAPPKPESLNEDQKLP